MRVAKSKSAVDAEEITGGVLAERLLGVPASPDADELFSCLSIKGAKTFESPLLELKASYLSNEVFQSEREKRNADGRCHWYVVKAMIAMANSCGGCILLGLKEKFASGIRLVDAVAIDPMFDVQSHEPGEFLDHIRSRLMRGDGEFSFNDDRIFKVEGGLAQLQRQIKLYYVRSRLADGYAVAIVVRPIPVGGDLIVVQERVRHFTKDAAGVVVNKGYHDRSQKIFYRSTESAKVLHVEMTNEDPFPVRMKKYQDFARSRKLTFPSFVRILEQSRSRLKVLADAAENGIAEAQYILGVVYKTGTHGLRQDKARALSWYRKAAANNYAEAELWMSRAYATGYGSLPIDRGLELKYLIRAAEHEEETAQVLLAMRYERLRNGEKALEWYFRAARNKNDEAECKIGLAYYRGKWGVGVDYAEAFKWFDLARQHENIDALEYLAEMYEKGRGVKVSKTQAAKLRKQAFALRCSA